MEHTPTPLHCFRPSHILRLAPIAPPSLGITGHEEGPIKKGTKICRCLFIAHYNFFSLHSVFCQDVRAFQWLAGFGNGQES